MELINNFSVGNSLKQSDKKNIGKISSENVVKALNENVKKRCLSNEVLHQLIQLGYKIDIIITLHKLYHFTTVEDAVFLLGKDLESKHYNHKFYKEAKQTTCFLCGGKKEEHSISINEIEKKPTNTTVRSKTKTFDYEKYSISKDILDSFDNPDICRICFNNAVNKKNIAQQACRHFFCDNCIKTYLTTNITNGKVISITCLMGGCPHKYTSKEIKSNVSPDIYYKYRKFKNEKVKLSNHNKAYVNCPYPDCDEIVDCENNSNGFVQCENNHIFCMKCKQLGRHKNNKCQDEDFTLLQEIKKQKHSKFKNFKQCPQCKVIIEKNEGCNQMHCINCGYDFCWLCMKKYTPNHYAIFNINGCPGMRFDSDKGSKCRQNKLCNILWYIMSCVLGLFVILLIMMFYLFFGCAYEFVKCYLNDEDVFDEDEEKQSYYSDEFEVKEEQWNKKETEDNVYKKSENYKIEITNKDSKEMKNEEKKKDKSIIVIILLIILGFVCQPIYVILYMIYALMQCLKRCNCWLFYAVFS